MGLWVEDMMALEEVGTRMAQRQKCGALPRDHPCYGAAPTEGQRSLVNDQEGLGAK